MMRTTTLLLLLLLASFNSYGNQSNNVDSSHKVSLKSDYELNKESHRTITWKVSGRLDDVSPNEEWVLYRDSYDWYEDGEYRWGSLRLINTKTRKVIVVLNQIVIESMTSFFLNDSTVAIPECSGISLYDLNNEKFNEPLISSESDWLKCSLSEDRTKAAILFRSPTKHEVNLKILDLSNNKEYVIGHHFFRPECCSDFHIEDILWHGDHVIYSFWTQLYHYKLGQAHDTLISDQMYTYSIDNDHLLFAERIFAENRRDRDTYNLKKFSFRELETSELKLRDDTGVIDNIYSIELRTIKMNNRQRSILNVNVNGDCFIKDNDGLERQDKSFLYKTYKLSIEEGDDTSPLLILKRRL